MRESSLIDGKSFVIDNDFYQLRIFAPDLAREIPYILEKDIKAISIETMEPVALHEYTSGNRDVVFRKMENADVDLAPLRSCDKIEWLALGGNFINSDALKELSRLRVLSIDNSSNKNQVRLDWFSSLEILYMTKPNRNIVGLSECRGLKELAIWNYAPKTRDLQELAKLHNLRKIQLVQPRIDTLSGIEALEALKSFEVYYSRTLRDISALEKCPRLENIVLEHIPKIKPTDKDSVW